MKRHGRNTNKHGRHTALRVAALFLALLFVLPFFSFAAADASAAAEPNDSFSGDGAESPAAGTLLSAERFFCSNIYSFRGSAVTEENGTLLSLHFYGSAAYFIAEADGQSYDAATNAFRFTVAEASRSARISVEYSYEGSGDFEEGDCVSFEVEKSASERSYTVAVPHAGQVRRLRLSTGATGLTSFSLRSLAAVSAFADGTEFIGTIESCILSKDGAYAVLRGSIPAATVVQFRDAQLCAYVIGALESAPKNGQTPAVSAPISARFEIKIPVGSADLLGHKYLLTVVGADGEERAVAAARFADAAEDTSDTPLPFKGAADCNTTASGGGSVLIDVDLTELFDPRGSGYAYRYDGVFHYFRRSAIDTLRAAVERYRAENTAVMFRILCTNPGQPVVYTYSYNESGVFNYAINASTEEGRRALGAAVTYLVHELLGGDNYSVAGIVLGKNIENSGEYNFMSAGLALDEYAEKYLLALRTVYLAARRAGCHARICVGMGDEWQNDNVGRKYLYPNYDAALLLETLAGRAAAEGGIRFSVLIQADGHPKSYSADGADIFGLSVASGMLKTLSEKTDRLSPLPLLLWSPAAGVSACTDYAYLYYCACFAGTAECFLLDMTSLSLLPDKTALLELYSLIDTVRTLNATAPFFSAAGLSAESIPGFNGALLVSRTFSEEQLSASLPAGGRVTVCDFSGSETGQLIAGAGAAVSYRGQSAHCEFSSDAETSAVFLKPAVVKNLSVADGIWLELRGDFDGERTLTLTACSGMSERRYTCVITGGERIILSASGALADTADTVSVKLTLSDGALDIFSIGACSAEKSTEELQQALLLLQDANGEEGIPARKLWGAAMLAVIPVSAVTAFMMRRQRSFGKEQEENTRKT